jgi:hypothetical protein
VIYSKAIDPDQLVARLDDIKARTESSIELSRSLIDQSFLRFKATHRNLYAAQRSQELLKALPKTSDSAAVVHEQSDHPARTRQRRIALDSGITAADLTCDHCEGILLDNKAYRVRTEDRGLILLDMIVCYACNLEAKNLGLKTDEIVNRKPEAEVTLQENHGLDLACAG